MAVLVFLALFLALTSQSNGNYCLCKDGVNQQAQQKALDYACGAGADCNQILTNGPCFQPNTVKDHCSYAVNSYFQKKGQVQGSCDFGGAATPSVTLTSSVASGCVYPASPSTAGNTPTTPSMTPGTPSTTNPGMTPTVFGNGISPTGSGGTGFNDGSGSVGLSERANLIVTLALTLWLSVLLLLWG